MTTLAHLFRRKKRRWLQRLTGVHAVHHDRYSFGLKMPFTHWVYFPARSGRDYSYPAHWKRCAPATYHDCTQTGRY